MTKFELPEPPRDIPYQESVLRDYALASIKPYQEKIDAMRTEIERLSLDLHEARETIARLRKERDALRGALTSIADYWNQDQNEAAMSDACWHAIDKARAALAQEQGD